LAAVAPPDRADRQRSSIAAVSRSLRDDQEHGRAKYADRSGGRRRTPAGPCRRAEPRIDCEERNTVSTATETTRPPRDVELTQPDRQRPISTPMGASPAREERPRSGLTPCLATARRRSAHPHRRRVIWHSPASRRSRDRLKTAARSRAPYRGDEPEPVAGEHRPAAARMTTAGDPGTDLGESSGPIGASAPSARRWPPCVRHLGGIADPAHHRRVSCQLPPESRRAERQDDTNGMLLHDVGRRGRVPR